MEGIQRLTAVLVLSLFSVVLGFRSFQLQIPNGDKVKHPCQPGRDWPTVGHANWDYTPVKNLFGEAWKDSSYNWKTVCPLDSDGDGMTNGEELGDPNCVWEFGQRPTSGPKGHPGFCDQGRAKCTTDDRAIAAECRHLQFRREMPKGGTPQRPPRLPPDVGNDHPQTRFRKWGQPSQPSGSPIFPAPGPSLPGFPQPQSFQRTSSVPHTRRFTGFERLAGLSVFGPQPGQTGVWQQGSGSFSPGAASGDTSGSTFVGGSSPGFMSGFNPPFLGGSRMMSAVGTGDMSPGFPMSSQSEGTPLFPGVNGIVSGTGTPGMRMRVSGRAFGSSPGHMMVMRSNGGIPVAGLSPATFRMRF